MKRVFAVIACGVTLSACESFNMPSMDSFRPAPTLAEVRVESEPAGAEAKGPTGPGCRTPCTLAIPASGATTVTFSLQGYLPTQVPVTVTTANESGGMSDSGSAAAMVIDPNPVFAQLQIAPPPPPPPRKKAPAKPKPKPRVAPQAQQAPAPPPPQQQGFGPPQQQQPGGFGPPTAPPSSVFR